MLLLGKAFSLNIIIIYCNVRSHFIFIVILPMYERNELDICQGLLKMHATRNKIAIVTKRKNIQCINIEASLLELSSKGIFQVRILQE